MSRCFECDTTMHPADAAVSLLCPRCLARGRTRMTEADRPLPVLVVRSLYYRSKRDPTGFRSRVHERAQHNPRSPRFDPSGDSTPFPRS